MEITSFNGMSEEEVVLFIVNLTEISNVLQKIEGTNRVIELSKSYSPIFKLTSNKSYYYYNLSVAWSDAYKFKYDERVDLWNWVQEELENEIYYLRLSLIFFDYESGDKTLLANIYTNLGNALNIVGRFVEALDNWDKALKTIPNFNMALVNKGRCLFYHSSYSLYDEGHKDIFLQCAYKLFKEALEGNLTEEAKRGLLRDIEQIERVGIAFLKKEIKFNDSFDGLEKGERKYRQWCLNNCLFLNELNEVLVHPVVAHDPLHLPNMIVETDTGPFYHDFFNQIKQEYISSRYLFFESLNEDYHNFSDKEIHLLDTLEYSIHSHKIEKKKLAYRSVYSIFDKIAFFLNTYLNFSKELHLVSFKSLWFKKDKKNLKDELSLKRNIILRGLFWLSKDLFEENFKNSIEPDSEKLVELRNYIEHRCLKVIDLEKEKEEFIDITNIKTINKLSLSISLGDFDRKILKLLKLIREAIIYLSLAVNIEERLNANKWKGKQIASICFDKKND